MPKKLAVTPTAMTRLVVLDVEAALEVQRLGVVVHRGDGALEEADVALLGADRAEEPGDVAGVEAGGRDLVEQRVEGVVVVPVDQRDVDVGALELADGGDAAEPTSDDDDVGTLWTGDACSRPCFQSSPRASADRKSQEV